MSVLYSSSVVKNSCSIKNSKQSLAECEDVELLDRLRATVAVQLRVLVGPR